MAVLTSPPVEQATAVRASGSARARRGDTAFAAVFLAPGLLAFVVFVIVPAVGGLALSFFDWDLFDDPTFVGIDNLARVFTDPQMWSSLWVSVMFIVLGVVPTTVMGFLLAVVASSSLPGTGAIRVLYFSPMVASSAVAAVLWTNIYQPRFGLLNGVLGAIGIAGPNWLSTPGLARPALVVVLIWSSLPVVIILFIAAIQKVPDDLYAASALDGAGKWRQLWSITWPSVRPTTLVVLILMVITFLGGTLEFAILMTGGGPLGETTSLALYAYKVAFEQHDLGYASALSLFQLVLIVAVYFLARGIANIWRSRR